MFLHGQRKKFSSSIIKQGRKWADKSEVEKEANDRISEHRQRDLEINVTNHEKKPIAGIEVEIKQNRHEFAFGSAMNDQVLFNQQYADFL